MRIWMPLVVLGLMASPAAARPVEHHNWPRHIAREYKMFTPAGNRAVRHVVWRAARQLRAGASRERTMRVVRRAYLTVEKRYDEAFDTQVRERFADELDKWLVAAGDDPVESYDEFAF